MVQALLRCYGAVGVSKSLVELGAWMRFRIVGFVSVLGRRLEIVLVGLSGWYGSGTQTMRPCVWRSSGLRLICPCVLIIIGLSIIGSLDYRSF